MVNKGGVAEMASLLLLIAQETEQKMTSKPEAEGEGHAEAEKQNAAEGSSSGGGAPDKTHSSYSGAPRTLREGAMCDLQSARRALSALTAECTGARQLLTFLLGDQAYVA